MKKLLSMKRYAWLVILLAAGLFATLPLRSTVAKMAQGAQAEDSFKATTVILVRHAEKVVTLDSDPPLSEAGAARSQKLAKLLAEAGIKAIYSSQYLRTKQTAEPLSRQLGIAITPLNIQTKQSNPREVSEQSIRLIVDKIYEHPGDTALIVGHSNSIPEVIKMLGGDIVPVLDEKKFDDLFIVTVYAKGKAKVSHLKYE